MANNNKKIIATLLILGIALLAFVVVGLGKTPGGLGGITQKDGLKVNCKVGVDTGVITNPKITSNDCSIVDQCSVNGFFTFQTLSILNPDVKVELYLLDEQGITRGSETEKIGAFSGSKIIDISGCVPNTDSKVTLQVKDDQGTTTDRKEVSLA